MVVVMLFHMYHVDHEQQGALQQNFVFKLLVSLSRAAAGP